MKEAIEKILHEFTCTYKQINLDSPTARELLAEFISDKLSGSLESDPYNNDRPGEDDWVPVWHR